MIYKLINNNNLDKKKLFELMADLAKSAKGNRIKLAEVIGDKWDREKVEQYLAGYFGISKQDLNAAEVTAGQLSSSKEFRFEDFSGLKTSGGKTVKEITEDLPHGIRMQVMYYLDKGLFLLAVDAEGIKFSNKDEVSEALEVLSVYHFAYTSGTAEDCVAITILSGADSWFSDDEKNYRIQMLN